MSDQGEKTCPLCAEEMDLTDQQLKPCKCGYEICVWCWHQILDLAEKNDTEGRCPACRTQYDKEKIVGMSANCKRQVADTGREKKKSQKAKTRTSEERMQLSSIRVVQRHLVYIVGLPLTLADEKLLLRKEYFGQYGKVLKVSMSRTSTGTVQQFANNTCSVYITYSKEEEAARCIHSVHGFTLEGNSLRACFGTTKYCHAWLRNVPCTNSDCLYLHEIGSQEDSFAKEESVSAYSRVQQITGVTNDLQWRSGNVLPPPVDDCCSDNSSTSGKLVVKNTPNNIGSSAGVSPPARSVGRTGALPATASWGTRASNCQSSSGSSVCSNGPAKQNPDASSASKVFSTAVARGETGSVQTSDLGRKIILNYDTHPKELNNKPKLLENVKLHAMNLQTNLLDSHTPLIAPAAPVETRRHPSPPIKLDSKTRPPIEEPSVIVCTEDSVFAADQKNDKVFSVITPINIDKQCVKQNSEVARPKLSNGLSLDCFLVRGYQGLQSNYAKLQDHLASSVGKAAMSVDGASASRSDVQSSSLLNLPSEKKEDFDIQKRLDSVASPTSLFSSSHSCDVLDHLRSPSLQCSDAAGAINYTVNLAVNKQGDEYLPTITSNPLAASDQSSDNQALCNSGIGYFCVLPDELRDIQVGTSDNQAINIDLTSGMDLMESSIISNILSLDLDAWDDTLTSQDLVKLLGENERHQSTSNLFSSRKAQNSNQSRFSFARKEESRSHFLDVEASFLNGANLHSSNPALVATREPYPDRLGNGFEILQHNVEHYDGVGSSQSFFSTDKHPVSRAQISAPPGFSVHSRIPPPGFSSHGTCDQRFHGKPGNHFLGSMSLRNPYEASPCVNSSSITDIEFIDPAILAVGEGRPPSSLSHSTIDTRCTFSSQVPAFENEPRLPILMQRSLQPHQNHRYTDIRDNYPPSDAYVLGSRLLGPSQTGSLSSFSEFARQPMSVMSNGHLDTWPEGMAGNNMGMAEIFRNNQPIFNKPYGGYDMGMADSKLQISGSGDMFNRKFGL